LKADQATKADSATEATHAAEADHALSADQATSATEADHASTADRATTADSATEATHATEADHSSSADRATTADSATEATHATEADHALRADQATTADFALASGDNPDSSVPVVRLAVVTTGLRSGQAPVAGTAFYTDPIAAMDDLATWCPSPSPESPCLLQIMPGEYDLGTRTLEMASHVTIEGAGEKLSVLKRSDYDVNDPRPAVVCAGFSELRSLTLLAAVDPNHAALSCPEEGYDFGLGGDPSVEVTLRSLRIGSSGKALRVGDGSIQVSDSEIECDGDCVVQELGNLTVEDSEIQSSGGRGILVVTSSRQSQTLIRRSAVAGSVRAIGTELGPISACPEAPWIDIAHSELFGGIEVGTRSCQQAQLSVKATGLSGQVTVPPDDIQCFGAYSLPDQPGFCPDCGELDADCQ
jgi:hypothetical protein